MTINEAYVVTPFEPEKYFTTSDAQQALLDEAFASGDAAFIAEAIGVVARARGMGAVARDSGVARAPLYKALSRDGNPSLKTLLSVLAALGLTLKATPREA